jgi:hypothetical protein
LGLLVQSVVPPAKLTKILAFRPLLNPVAQDLVTDLTMVNQSTFYHAGRNCGSRELTEF